VNCGHAQIVGLPPVFGEFSINANKRGFPRSCPDDSTAMTLPFSLVAKGDNAQK
jgi:hypothetical protein